MYTLAEVKRIDGQPGNYTATIHLNPRYVEDRTATSKCVEDCPVEISNDFNYGMDKTKAVYLPYEMAYPMNLVADGPALKKAQGTAEYKAFEESCAAKGIRIDLDAKPETFDVQVDSVVWATGWRPVRRHQARQTRIRQVRQRDYQRHDGATCFRERPHQGGDRQTI